MPETKVVKGSIEDILEQIYQRLEKEYEYDGKEVQLNTLQEIMITLTKIGDKDRFFEEWYHGE